MGYFSISGSAISIEMHIVVVAQVQGVRDPGQIAYCADALRADNQRPVRRRPSKSRPGKAAKVTACPVTVRP